MTPKTKTKIVSSKRLNLDCLSEFKLSPNIFFILETECRPRLRGIYAIYLRLRLSLRIYRARALSQSPWNCSDSKYFLLFGFTQRLGFLLLLGQQVVNLFFEVEPFVLAKGFIFFGLVGDAHGFVAGIAGGDGRIF